MKSVYVVACDVVLGAGLALSELKQPKALRFLEGGGLSYLSAGPPRGGLPVANVFKIGESRWPASRKSSRDTHWYRFLCWRDQTKVRDGWFVAMLPRVCVRVCVCPCCLETIVRIEKTAC